MIYAFMTLKNTYADKKIYLWNVNRDSIGMFTALAFRRIPVEGFVTFGEYAGESYMNRTVRCVYDLEQEEDGIILVADSVSKDLIGTLPGNRAVYWSDALVWNDKICQERKLIVYGIGWGAQDVCRKLSDRKREADLYCVTKKNGVAQFNGKEVITAEELNKYPDYAILVSVKSKEFQMQILETLHGFQGPIYLDFEHLIDDTSVINFVQCLNTAIQTHKKAYIYGKMNATTELLESILSAYGVRFGGYVNDFADKKQQIEDIYTLSYEGIENKLIVLNEYIPKHIVRARTHIEFAGFSLEAGNYTGFQSYTTEENRLMGRLPFLRDPLAGISICYPKGKAGWNLYGKEEEGRIRILVLGGSTSSEEYHVKVWPKRLQDTLNDMGIQTTVYNGAHPGDDIVDELLRILRDGAQIRPHIVISMSGVNNLHKKISSNPFNEERITEWIHAKANKRGYCSGLHTDESLYAFWKRNMGLLKVISKFYGAVFFGILQPMNMAMESMNLCERALYEQEMHKMGAEEFMHHAEHADEYINLMQLFEHRDEMYFDVCHYTDKAHEILADQVLKTIIQEVKKLKTGRVFLE